MNYKLDILWKVTGTNFCNSHGTIKTANGIFFYILVVNDPDHSQTDM